MVEANDKPQALDGKVEGLVARHVSRKHRRRPADLVDPWLDSAPQISPRGDFSGTRVRLPDKCLRPNTFIGVTP
ncbi:MAG: hypothetical protein KDG52_21535 [Rhodocyclaceae bacterium]|nr:hypothetical protein [Rhodocyclaceae bacterium]